MASHLYTNPPQNLHFISSSSSLKPHLCLSFKRINPKHKSSSSSVFVPYASQSSIAITSKERWSLNGMSALVTGGTRGIGFVSLHNKCEPLSNANSQSSVCYCLNSQACDCGGIGWSWSRSSHLRSE